MPRAPPVTSAILSLSFIVALPFPSSSNRCPVRGSLSPAQGLFDR
jgi:hypothetical protein